MATTDLRGELSRLRQRLLDLTNRNTLVNYRATRGRTLYLVGEDADFLFEHLVERRKTFVFDPAPEPPQSDDVSKVDTRSTVDPIVPNDSETVAENQTDAPAADRAISTEAPSALGDGEVRLLPAPQGFNPPIETSGEAIGSSEPFEVDLENAAAPPPDNPQPTSPAAAANPKPNAPSIERLAEMAANPRDLRLQTKLTAEVLESTLRNLRRAASTAVEETGINYLHLALGFLSWTEQESSRVSRLAPLILIPVVIERSFDARQERYLYTLRWTEEEIQHNLSLDKRLERDFGLRLPKFEAGQTQSFEEGQTQTLGEGQTPSDQTPSDQTPSGQTPSGYFGRVERMTASRPGWTVNRQMLVGFFSFHKLMMYADLQDDAWAESGAMAEGSVLADIVLGSERSETALYAKEYDIDRDDDAIAIPLPLDIDSSQHSALVDIAKGRNLVIEGPPGTGKSQTITAAIATAMSAGKTVLFVAEKMAALEVVHAKLKSIGLGPFCLDMHSDSASPRRVMASLKERLEARFALPEKVDELTTRLGVAQNEIAAYLQATSQIVEPLGRPLYELFWQVIELRQRGIHPLDGDAANALPWQVNSETFARNRELLEVLANACGEFRNFRDNPWRGFEPSCATGQSAGPIEGALREMREIAIGRETLRQGLTSLVGTSSDPQSARRWDALATTELPQRLEALASADSISSRDLIARLIGDDEAATARQCCDQIEGYRAATGELAGQQLTPWENSAAKFAEVIPRIRPWAKRLQAVGVSDLRGLRLWAQETKRTIDQACGFGKLLSAVGLGSARNFEELRQGLDRLRLFTHEVVADRQVITPAIFLPETPSAWGRGSTASSALRATREELANSMHLESIPPPDELRRIAEGVRAHLRRWLRFLKGEYRHGIAAIARFWRTGVAADPNRQLAAIEQYQQFVPKLEAFATDATLRRLFGDDFQGIDTDWEKLHRRIGWVAKVRKLGMDHATIMRTFEAIDAALGQTALGQAASSAEVSLAESTETDPPQRLDADALATCIERADIRLGEQQQIGLLGWDSTTTGRIPLEELSSRLSEFESALADIETLIEPFSWQPQATLADTFRIAVLVVKTAKRKDELASDESSRRVLGKWHQGEQTDCAAIREALRCRESILATGLPQSEFEQLLAGESGTRLGEYAGLLRQHQPLAARWQLQRDSLGAHGELSPHWLCWDETSGEPAGGSRDAKAPTPERSLVERIDRLSEQIDRLIGGMSELPSWANVSQLIARCRDAGLTPVVDSMLWGERASGMREVYVLTVLTRVAREVMSRSNTLTTFSRQSLQAARETYQKLDTGMQKLTRLEMAHKIASRPIPPGVSRGRVGELTQLGLIMHESQKQSRHCRVRDLLGRAGAAVQALKPCFMMSPLSVAQFADAGTLRFDLVIMDEASQIRPEDALGALARGQQMVVVGDPKQLPPTSFFDGDAEEVEADEATSVDNTESILEAAMKTCQPVRRLRWHYRSRHESLIAFSNEHFYDGDLIVFPSPGERSGRLGVSHQRIENGFFKDRRNLTEAQAVVEAVVEHAIAHPDESLGIGTFNRPQCDLIAEMVDRRCQQDPQAREAIDKLSASQEPFFVKNLENLQGDERDVIFISYTYGRDEASGRVFNRFGPINSEVGWRRLNVLVTRARKRVRVFSSLSPEEIQITPRSSRGLVAFRDYLKYAQTGESTARPKVTGRQPDSPFEIAVAGIVRSIGLHAEPQVGVAGYFIDIGVRLPDSADFLLGIECDGATYHGSVSARDRDRLREEVIRSRGWHLHRIWSTDWFLRQSFEVERLQAAIRTRLAGDGL
jgi:very-short-patch-repair endonuclease